MSKKWLLTLLLGGTTLGAGTAIDNRIDPYQSKPDRYEISESSTVKDAGTVKTEVHKDEPKVTMSRWGGEASMGVRYMGISSTTPGSRQLFTNRVEWKDSKKPNEEVHAYPLAKGEGMEDGGFEIEVVLNSKPDHNTFDFAIDGADALDFFYQPALTQEEIDDGSSRPDNVIGSYAVYHRFKKDHQEGLTNYATGKAYHIYRPKAIDANGAEQWADLSYDDAGTLTVTVPQDYLDKAVYPVKVDPTFGYLVQGATAQGVPDDLSGSRFMVPFNAGTITVKSVHGYTQTISVNGQSKGVIVNNATLAIVADGVGIADPVGCNTAGWKQSNYSTSPSLTGGTTYIFSIVTSGNCGHRYDTTTSSTDGFQDATNSHTTPTDPTDGVNQSRLYSVYVTYHAADRTINASNYTYCRTITSNNNGYTNGIATTTSGLFPLFASSTISTLAATSSGGNVQLIGRTASSTYTDEPIDIVFTDEATCSFNASIAAIPHYFEKYASTTGEFSVHLGTSDISSTTAKTLAMYYGNTLATNLNSPGQVYATTSPLGIVSHWDLSVPGYATTTYPDFTDSTYNNNHGSSATMNNADLVSAQVDGGLDFDATTDVVNVGSPSTLDDQTKLTLIAWIKPNSQGEGNRGTIVSKTSAINTDGWTWRFDSVSGNQLSFQWQGSTDLHRIESSSIPLGNLTHAAITLDRSVSAAASNLHHYINAAEPTYAFSQDGVTLDSEAASNLFIGNESTSAQTFDGLIDDVRFYNTALTHADIQTIYNTTRDSTTFWTIGNEQTQGGAPPPPPTDAPKDDVWFFLKIWPPLKDEKHWI